MFPWHVYTYRFLPAKNLFLVLLYFPGMRNRRERDGQIRFLRYRYGACDYRTTCSCIPFVHYVLCNWEPDRRMSHSCDLMGDVGSLFIAIARKGRGNRLAETDISSSGSRVDVDFRARISEKFLTIYQNF